MYDDDEEFDDADDDDEDDDEDISKEEAISRMKAKFAGAGKKKKWSKKYNISYAVLSLYKIYNYFNMLAF